MTKRDDFSDKVKETLARRVGTLCSNPTCGVATYGPRTEHDKSTNKGVAAHITGARPRAPRYDSTITPEERSSINNGIWLCQSCSKIIDNDEKKYTVELLDEWKMKAELRAREAIETPRIIETGNPNPQSILLLTRQQNTNLFKNGETIGNRHRKKITIRPIKAHRDLKNNFLPITNLSKQYPPLTSLINISCQNQSKVIDSNIKIDIDPGNALIKELQITKKERMQVIEGGVGASFISFHIPQLLPRETQSASLILYPTDTIDASLWTEKSGESTEVFIYDLIIS